MVARCCAADCCRADVTHYLPYAGIDMGRDGVDALRRPVLAAPGCYAPVRVARCAPPVVALLVLLLIRRSSPRELFVMFFELARPGC